MAKVSIYSFSALIYSPLSNAQESAYPPPPLNFLGGQESITSRYANARRGFESTQRALEAQQRALHVQQLQAEEERRKILWEREQAEWQQSQTEKMQKSKQAPSPLYDSEEQKTAEYQKKANQGINQYQTALGSRYASGKGCPKDLVLAYMWLNIASVSNPDASTILELVEKDMTPEQIAEGQKLSRNWKPSRQSGTTSNMPKPEYSNTIPNPQPPPADTSAEFNRGFKEGYKKANPYGIPPFPPFPELGHKTYQDGFGQGYAQAIQEAERR